MRIEKMPAISRYIPDVYRRWMTVFHVAFGSGTCPGNYGINGFLDEHNFRLTGSHGIRTIPWIIPIRCEDIWF
jgi:hypothetical protein